MRVQFGVFSTSCFVPAVLSSVELMVRNEDKTLQRYRRTTKIGGEEKKLQTDRYNPSKNVGEDKSLQTALSLVELVVRIKRYKQTDAPF